MMSERPPICRLLLLAFLLGLGIQIVAAVMLTWGTSVVGQFTPNEGRYESFVVLADGTPVIVSRSYTDYYDVEGKTLQGEPVATERLDKTLSAGALLPPKHRLKQFGRVNWSQRVVIFSDYRRPEKYWHFIHTGRKQGRGYFVGFDSKTKLGVGYIGRNGPRSTKPSSEECFALDCRHLSQSGYLVSGGDQYPSSYYYSVYRQFSSHYPEEALKHNLPPWTAYLRCGDELLEIDLREETVRVSTECDEPFSLGIARRAKPPEEEEDDFAKRPWCRQHLVIRTEDKVTLFDPRSDAREVYQIPPKARGRQFSFYEFADGIAMLHVSRRSEDGITPVDLYWVDQAEGVVRDVHLNLAARGNAPMDPRLASAGASLVVPVPAVWTVASLVAMPLSYTFSGQEPNYSAALARSLGEWWPALLISFAITGVAVWWCIKRQRQYAAQWTRTWVVFVLVLGLPAFLGYLLHRCWPSRVECPACKQAAPRDRLSCSECDADFPEPAPEGIEVFA